MFPNNIVLVDDTIDGMILKWVNGDVQKLSESNESRISRIKLDCMRFNFNKTKKNNGVDGE